MTPKADKRPQSNPCEEMAKALIFPWVANRKVPKIAKKIEIYSLEDGYRNVFIQV